MTEEKLREIEAAKAALQATTAERDTLADMANMRKGAEVDKHVVLEWLTTRASEEIKERVWGAVMEQLRREYERACEMAQDAQKAFDNL